MRKRNGNNNNNNKDNNDEFFPFKNKHSIAATGKCNLGESR